MIWNSIAWYVLDGGSIQVKSIARIIFKIFSLHVLLHSGKSRWGLNNCNSHRCHPALCASFFFPAGDPSGDSLAHERSVTAYNSLLIRNFIIWNKSRCWPFQYVAGYPIIIFVLILTFSQYAGSTYVWLVVWPKATNCEMLRNRERKKKKANKHPTRHSKAFSKVCRVFIMHLYVRDTNPTSGVMTKLRAWTSTNTSACGWHRSHLIKVTSE